MRFPCLRRHLASSTMAVCATLAALVAAPTALAGPLLKRIQARGSVKVCIWPDCYGITWRNPRNPQHQQLTGIDIALSAELARDLKAQLDDVKSCFSKLIEALAGAPSARCPGHALAGGPA